MMEAIVVEIIAAYILFHLMMRAIAIWDELKNKEGDEENFL